MRIKNIFATKDTPINRRCKQFSTSDIVLEYKGFTVYKYSDIEYWFCIDTRLVSQRAGYKATGREFIDSYCNSVEYHNHRNDRLTNTNN